MRESAGELVDQARLAHAGLAHNGHYLAVTGGGPLQGLRERLELALPTYKARQTTRGHSLEAAMDRTRPRSPRTLHRLRQPLQPGNWPELRAPGPAHRRGEGWPLLAEHPPGARSRSSAREVCGLLTAE